ncbi:ParB/RepB/Spo0J family partition protein [Caenispirillum bisanense]|uniref:Chromosome partitioning protein, ParB family n=1 Tax=Caenispirillum bisanense TaxID=414052 RepID=A0A286GTP8_9PROT|nr:ParB/RepB/Spo0J family partition protein [Caenispirillum bisanense]SOD98923.1 chromosome partitioning protein, ParB family [Caenispirillum bisanense]
MSAARRGLGRGLSALFGDTEDGLDEEVAAAGGPAAAGEAEQSERLTSERLVPIGRLRSGRFQPRKEFDQQAIDDLAESIREKGIIQPILVRKHPDDGDLFEIIAGERRWRAAQQAQLHEVPVLVKSFTDREALEVALVENLQRQDLTALEESEGYQRLMDEFHHTQEDLAKAVGKSRSHVANMMRLLNLPDPVKGMLREGKLTAGHARALLNAEDPVTLAERVVTRGLNVRQTEKLAVTEGKKQPRKKGTAPVESMHKDADTVALERDLSQLLGLKVSITFAGRGGALSIEYDTLEQLDDILHRLSDGAHKMGAVEEPLEADEDLDAAIAHELATADVSVAAEEAEADDLDVDTPTLKETVWEGGLDAVVQEDAEEDADDATEDAAATADGEDPAAPVSIEQAEADLKAALAADGLDGLDWSAEEEAETAEDEAAFDPEAITQALREEGLDALYEEDDADSEAGDADDAADDEETSGHR